MKIQSVGLYTIENKQVQAKKNTTGLASQPNFRQVDALSNVYYTSNVNFGRSKKEHDSWMGLHKNPETGKYNAKLFTHWDAAKVVLNVYDRDNYDDERFLNIPDYDKHLYLEGTKHKKTFPMRQIDKGVFELISIPADAIKEGDRYAYTIYKPNPEIPGTQAIDTVKDPYSMLQESLRGASTVYDHSRYEWKNNNSWQKNLNKISRIADFTNGLTSVQSANIYQINIPTLTKGGTFESAKAKLADIKAAGFNTIHIMPVENSYSKGWSYDGVDKFAVNAKLGGPDQLKDLIDYCHSDEIGLNVVMDMVPNHYGPDGNQIHRTGDYTRKIDKEYEEGRFGKVGSEEALNIKNSLKAFGDIPDFEGGDGAKYVRDYMVNAALNWVQNYHCDGLRLDMTKHMLSDRTMTQMATEIHDHYPDAFLIAEDSRGGVGLDGDRAYEDSSKIHDNRITAPLMQDYIYSSKNEGSHINAINKLDHCESIKHNASPSIYKDLRFSRLGMDTEWAFPFYHELNDALYGVCDFNKFKEAIYCAQTKVKYVMSHDEIGNYDGTRLTSKLMVPKLNLRNHVDLSPREQSRAKAINNEQMVKDQKAQFVANELAQMLQTGGLTPKNCKKVLGELGVHDSLNISYATIKSSYKKSVDQAKMAQAFTYGIPGPKMVFQGDENGDLTPFRFFREFESPKVEIYLHNEKGYDTGVSGEGNALEKSQLGSIKYTQEAQDEMGKHLTLSKDLARINKENPALTTGEIQYQNTIVHPSKVMGLHTASKDGKNEIYAITNFDERNYPQGESMPYEIEFPAGKWVQILNTDEVEYGGSGKYSNKDKAIVANGAQKMPINLAGYSTIYFQKVI